MDEDELLAELEFEEEELAAAASANEGGNFELILVGVLTVSLLVGGSALAAGYGSAGFNRQRTVEGSFGGIKSPPVTTGGVYSSANNKTQPIGGQRPATAPGPTPTAMRTGAMRTGG